MSVNIETYQQITETLNAKNATLVAVSKIRTADEIMQLYKLGHRDFGENYVQELIAKYEQLPKDIRWHFIGHLQSNKVKYIAAFVHLIHGVDKKSLLSEINKQAAKHNRQINCLLQLHIALESSKFGFDEADLTEISPEDFPNLQIQGMMGMASFTDNSGIIEKEFDRLNLCFETLKPRFPSFRIKSMGMSDDYKIALAKGSNMVRIGSLLFGKRGII